MLHYFGADSDLSFVGREDCGHMRVDAELLTPFDELWNALNAYILVSLPLMARWHSSKRFSAERILRQSGKFDYSAPQFFHIHNKYLYYDKLCWTVYYFKDPLKQRGPINFVTQLVLRCEFENQLEAHMVPILIGGP